MKKKFLALSLAVLMLFVCGGCSLFKIGGDDAPESVGDEVSVDLLNAEYPVSVSTALLSSRPGVIVSLSPSVTNKICDLELEDRLEGVSELCTNPKTADRQVCGSAIRPDIDAIESLSPHLVLAETELPADVTDRLEEEGVVVVVIPFAHSLAGLEENYISIARLMQGEVTGAAYGEKFLQDAFKPRLEEIKKKALEEPKNAVYIRALDYSVATGDTLEGELMEAAGFNNIAKAYKAWTYPEEEANDPTGRENFNSIDFIFCDKRSVTMKMMESSAFYKGLNAVLKDYYLYIDSSAFDGQSLAMFDELERMLQYALGEIPGSKGETVDEPASSESEQSSAPESSQTPQSQAPQSQAPAPPASRAPTPPASQAPAPSSSSQSEPPPESADPIEPPSDTDEVPDDGGDIDVDVPVEDEWTPDEDIDQLYDPNTDSDV